MYSRYIQNLPKLAFILTLVLIGLACGSDRTSKSCHDVSHVQSSFDLTSHAQLMNEMENLQVLGEDSLRFEGMSKITVGSFMMGSNSGFPDEGPRREVRISSFWMDEAEVTNAQFAEFVDATDYQTLAEKTSEIVENWKKFSFEPGSLVFVPDLFCVMRVIAQDIEPLQG